MAETIFNLTNGTGRKMIKIYTDFITKFNYDEQGNIFADGFPRMFFKSTETVQWQICASAMEDTLPSAWTKYTGYADYTSIGAYLTADNNYTQKLLGSVKNSIETGLHSTIVGTFSGASIAKIPSTGIISLFSASGDSETFEYSSRSISGTEVTFSFTTAITVSESYSAGAEMDVSESVYMQASLDTQTSDTANGLFCFSITAFSEKLRREIVYSNLKSLSIPGLELAIFSINSTANTVTDLERFMLESFSIRSGVADTGQNPQTTASVTNAVTTLVNTLVASGLQVQFSQNGTDWHDTQDTSLDAYYRFRNNASGGTWTTGICLPRGTKGEDCYVYIGYAEDSSGTNFSTNPSASLTYISFLVSAVAIATPTLAHFQAAGCVFIKYLGTDGTTPSIDSTTYNWKIGTTDTGVCAQGKNLQIKYSTSSSTETGSDWHSVFISGDLYCRFSCDGGTTWSSAMKFIGSDAPNVQQQFSETGALGTWHSTATSSDLYTRFSVDGGTTWSETIQCVPFKIKFQYAVDATSANFHDTYASGDAYMRMSTDNGTTWSSGMKFLGDDGTSFIIDASGTYADRTDYDSEEKGFSYLVTSGTTNEGMLYFKASDTIADWSDGIKFTPDGISMQYSVDGSTDWHVTAASTDNYIRFSVNGGTTWTVALQFRGDTWFLYVAYAKDNTGTDFSLTESSSLPYRAEFHSTTYIATPTLADFVTAGATWLKFLGADWITGNTVPTTSQGKDGDLYLNTSTGYLYRKVSGQWVQVINIIGPAGAGVTIKGLYSSSTTYSENDAVTYEGSMHIAKTTTTGNAPPSLPTIENTYWTTYIQRANDVLIQYSLDNVSFHYTAATNDLYIRFSYDGGTTWSTGIKFVGDGLAASVLITALTGTAATVEPGNVYSWTLTDNSTLSASGGITDNYSDCLIDISKGNYTLTAGTNMTIAGTLSATTVNRCAVRWNGTSAVLYVLSDNSGGGTSSGITAAKAKKIAMIFG